MSAGRFGRRASTAAAVLLAVLLAAAAGASAQAPVGAMLWGFNSYGQLGVGHLRIDGELEASDQPLLVEGIDGVRSLSQGYAGATAVMQDGSVMAWGANPFGDLGDGSNGGPEACPLLPGAEIEPCATAPEPVAGLPDRAVAVAKGYDYSLALLEDGTVWAWGINADGELGIGTAAGPESCQERFAGSPEACSTVPVQVPGLQHVRAVAAGATSSFALLEDGTVMAWGSAETGALGLSGQGEKVCEDNSQWCFTSPQRVEGVSDVTAIAAGSTHTLALLADGQIMAWGSGEDGQLGLGGQWGSAPAVLAGVDEAVQVAAGDDQSAALLSDGTVLAWGENQYGQLGQGTAEGPETCNRGPLPVACSTRPVAVPGITGATAIAAGWAHSLALLADGTLMAWGSNNGGTLGTGETGPEYCGADANWSCSTRPVPVDGLSGVTAIAVSAGGENSAAYGPLAPAVTSVEAGEAPQGAGAEGSQLGGTEVQITGTDFSDATAVRFGAREASFKLDSLGQITASAPPGTGIAEVTVTTPRGESPPVPGGSFHYTPPGAPSLSGLSPADGLSRGGTVVTVRGVGVAAATAVMFGAQAAQSFSVAPNGTLSAVAPPGAGRVDVRVITPEGETATVPGDQFSYVALAEPAISAVRPNAGTSVGAMHVQISGSGFADVTSVTFAGTPAAGYTVNSPTSITAIVPPGTAGEAQISVVTAAGASASGKHSRFTYSKPAILGVSPSEGGSGGGGSVTIQGTGFAIGGATTFTFGKTRAGSVQCATTFVCTAVVPAAAKAGSVLVSAAVGRLRTSRGGERVYDYR